MAAGSVGSTDPRLLVRVAALQDNPAWDEFRGRYEPFVRARCSVYGLDAEAVDELCQRIWVELARRMPVYRYDPGRSFRGWLRRLCHHRAIDLLRERRDHRFEDLSDEDLTDVRWPGKDGAGEAEDRDAPPGRLQLLAEAQAAQEAVRRRVKPARWEAFWQVVIEGQPIGDVAAALGLKYATVYAGVNHVAEMLRAEGRRRGRLLGLHDSEYPAKV